MRKFKKLLLLTLFIFVDINIWLIINIISGKLVVKTFKLRPWMVFKIRLDQESKNNFKLALKKIIAIRTKSLNFFSSCLSKSISARILLDIVRVENTLNLAIYKSEDGSKVFHAFLEDSLDGSLFTGNPNTTIKILSTFK